MHSDKDIDSTRETEQPELRARRIRRGIPAAAVAFGLLASACGGAADDGAQDQSAPPVDEPEENLALADEPADTTTSTTAPSSTTTTTTTEAPEAVDPFAETTEEIEIVAQPLSAEMGRDEVLGSVASVMGPTDDFVGTLGRLAPIVPPLPTLPDTDVVKVRFSNNLDLGSGQNTAVFDVDFLTSDSRQDAALAVADAMKAAGWEVDNGEQIQGDIGFSIVDARLVTESGVRPFFSLSFSDTTNGGSVGQLTYNNPEAGDASSASVGQNWVGNAPLPEGGEFNRFSATVDASRSRNYEVTLNSSYEYVGDTAELNAEALALLPSSDWELNGEPGANTVRLAYEGSDLSVMDFIGDPDPRIALQTTTILEAPQLIPEFAQGPGTAAPSTGETDAGETDAGDSDAGDSDDSGKATTFAAANGPELDRSMDAAAIEAHLFSLIGPTDDVAGTAARLGLFPEAAPSFPGAFITIARLSSDTDALFELQEASEARTSISMDFFASTPPEEVVETVQIAMTGSGFTLENSGNDQSGDVTVFFASFTDERLEGNNNFRVRARLASDGSTLVDYFYLVSGEASLSDAEVANGWYGESPVGPGGQFKSSDIGIQVTSATAVSYNFGLQEQFTDTSEEEQRQALIAAAATDDWTVLEAGDDIISLDFNDSDSANASFSSSSSTPSDVTVRVSVTRRVVQE